MFVKRINFSPEEEGGEGGGNAQPIDFAANEEAARAYFTGKGFVIETKEGITEKFVKPEVSTAVRKTHEDWESGLGEILGAKPGEAKGLNWAKETVKEKIKPVVKTPKPEGEKNSVAADELKAEIKALREKDEARDRADAQKAIDQETKTINGVVKAGFKAIKFNPEDEADDAQRRENAELIIKAKYKIKLNDDNEPVLYKGEDVVIDSDTQKPITLDKLVKRDIGFAIAAEKINPIGGTGSGKKDVFREVDGVQAFVGTTMRQIREKSAELGLAVGSEARNKFITASAKASNLDPKGL